jgi:hypothetical protein
MKSFWFPGAPEKVTVMVWPGLTGVGEALRDTGITVTGLLFPRYTQVLFLNMRNSYFSAVEG